MTPPRVVEIADGREFHGLGAPVVRLVHPKTTESNQLGVSIALMPPASVVKRHRHDYEEAYFVVDGTGVMFLDGVGDIELHPGLSVYIPPNTIHGQVNTSQTEDLRIVCSLSPPPVEGEIPELFE